RVAHIATCRRQRCRGVASSRPPAATPSAGVADRHLPAARPSAGVAYRHFLPSEATIGATRRGPRAPDATPRERPGAARRELYCPDAAAGGVADGWMPGREGSRIAPPCRMKPPYATPAEA